MKTRLTGTIIALLVATSSAVSVRAHSTGSQHFYGSCASGNTGFNQQRWIDPLPHSGGTYDFAASTVTVRNLYQCTSPSGSNYGFSIVNAANLDLRNGGAGLLQLGYGVCSVCNNFPGVSTEEFWWTKNHDGNIFAATWVDFNSDGIHDRPTVGRSYTFSIEITNPGTAGSTWIYTIKDLYTGLSDSKTVAYSVSPAAQFPWWSYERQNSASAIGSPANTGNDIDMRNMKYSTIDTGVVELTGSTYTCWDNNPVTYDQCTVDKPDSVTHMHMWTLEHG